MPGFHENIRAILKSIALASGGLSYTVSRSSIDSSARFVKLPGRHD
jgi:hypothetical protein